MLIFLGIFKGIVLYCRLVCHRDWYGPGRLASIQRHQLLPVTRAERPVPSSTRQTSWWPYFFTIKPIKGGKGEMTEMSRCYFNELTNHCRFCLSILLKSTWSLKKKKSSTKTQLLWASVFPSLKVLVFSELAAEPAPQEAEGRGWLPCVCSTHLCLWGAPFISNQQQIALSINDNLLLEPATCHTKHGVTEENQRVRGQTDVGFACGKIHSRWPPWGQRAGRT
jgi:hypothetical protein